MYLLFSLDNQDHKINASNLYGNKMVNCITARDGSGTVVLFVH